MNEEGKRSEGRNEDRKGRRGREKMGGGGAERRREREGREDKGEEKRRERKGKKEEKGRESEK